MSHTIAELRSLNPMWVYEHNYVTLLELFPFLKHDQRDEVYYINEDSELKIHILERCKFTNIIQIELNYLNDTERQKLVTDVKFMCRVYYDANLVEVISYQNLARLLPEYTFPNKQMCQPDEKQQANLLFYDWLASIIAGRYRAKEQVDCSNA
ncbi:MAG: DUF1249 domain-containing protein [Gammaproteobacteria bacterium]